MVARQGTAGHAMLTASAAGRSLLLGCLAHTVRGLPPLESPWSCPLLAPQCTYAILPPLLLAPPPCRPQMVKELLEGFKEEWAPVMENLEIADEVGRVVRGLGWLVCCMQLVCWVGWWEPGVKEWCGGASSGAASQDTAGGSTFKTCDTPSAIAGEPAVGAGCTDGVHHTLSQAFDDIDGLLDDGPQAFDSSRSVWHQTGATRWQLAGRAERGGMAAKGTEPRRSVKQCKLPTHRWLCMHRLSAHLPAHLPLPPTHPPPLSAHLPTLAQAGARWRR